MSETASKNTNTKQSAVKTTYEWLETFCVALLWVVLIFTFLCRFVTVSGESMTHTLQHNDRLIISDLFYEPKCGDVVVIHDSTEPLFQGPIIKRVIATEGETVDIDKETWKVTVTDKEGNTRVLDEPYVRCDNFNAPMLLLDNEFLYPNAITTDEFPHTVEEGCVFVMGDNRNGSLDSRFVGDIDKRMILGKAYVRVFPLNEIRFGF